ALIMYENQEKEDNAIVRDITDGIVAVNCAMFGRENLEAFKIIDLDKQALIRQVKDWLAFIQNELEVRKNITVKVDYDFHVLMQHIKMSTKEELVQESLQSLLKIRQGSENTYQSLIRFYNAFSDFWGCIDIDRGELDLFIDRADQLKEHYEDFCWLYEQLGDYRSKKVLYGILYFWLSFDYEEKKTMKENNFDDYYDFDLLQCDENEVLVDLGAYTGDSAQSYIVNYGNYKRIYCYEISQESITKMQKKLSPYENITIRNVAVGAEEGTLYFKKGAFDSSNQVSDSGDIPVPVVTLDQDIQEPITLIKMDIEGSELNAIEGAVEHIRKDRPKLAVCTYHNNHHIWEIPRRLIEINPDYKLYMRYNGGWNSFSVGEFVTFAINE
ncbi:MAG: FkbM family methyltransferase, partial [Lachnospiraceae bacterium]|nr:FkbM family methyltransferase [Lachnospiraceae bacterium]